MLADWRPLESIRREANPESRAGPPGSDAHTYLFTVHALNQQVEVADDASATEVVDLLNQTSILESSVSGTYARSS